MRLQTVVVGLALSLSQGVGANEVGLALHGSVKIDEARRLIGVINHQIGLVNSRLKPSEDLLAGQLTSVSESLAGEDPVVFQEKAKCSELGPKDSFECLQKIELMKQENVIPNTSVRKESRNSVLMTLHEEVKSDLKDLDSQTLQVALAYLLYKKLEKPDLPQGVEVRCAQTYVFESEPVKFSPLKALDSSARDQLRFKTGKDRQVLAFTGDATMLPEVASVQVFAKIQFDKKCNRSSGIAMKQKIGAVLWDRFEKRGEKLTPALIRQLFNQDESSILKTLNQYSEIFVLNETQSFY